MRLPVATSHTCTVLSDDPDAIYLPSGDQATELTAVGTVPKNANLDCTKPEWPSYMIMRLPVATSDTCTLPPYDPYDDPEAILLPSGDQATENTESPKSHLSIRSPVA